jgi:hypothetical protein
VQIFSYLASQNSKITLYSINGSVKSGKPMLIIEDLFRYPGVTPPVYFYEFSLSYFSEGDLRLDNRMINITK